MRRLSSVYIGQYWLHAIIIYWRQAVYIVQFWLHMIMFSSRQTVCITLYWLHIIMVFGWWLVCSTLMRKMSLLFRLLSGLKQYEHMLTSGIIITLNWLHYNYNSVSDSYWSVWYAVKLWLNSRHDQKVEDELTIPKCFFMLALYCSSTTGLQTTTEECDQKPLVANYNDKSLTTGFDALNMKDSFFRYHDDQGEEENISQNALTWRRQATER